MVTVVTVNVTVVTNRLLPNENEEYLDLMPRPLYIERQRGKESRAFALEYIYININTI